MSEQRLSPRTVVQLIDRTFRIYRDNFLLFIVLLAVVAIPSALVVQAVNYSYATSRLLRTAATDYTVVLLLIGLVQFVLTSLVNGIITFTTSEHLLGRKLPFAEVFAAVRRRLWPLVGSIILVVVLLIGVVIALYAGAFVCRGGILLAVPPLLYIGMAVYFFLVPVMILENVGASRGINRSMKLAKERFWPVFGLAVGIYVITLIVNAALGTGLDLVLDAANLNYSVVAVLAGQVLALLTAPILPIGLTVMYYDTRIRLEGLDLALLALDVPNPRPSDIYSPPVSGPFLNGRDLRNILVLTGLVIVVYLVLGAGVFLLFEMYGFPL